MCIAKIYMCLMVNLCKSSDGCGGPAPDNFGLIKRALTKQGYLVSGIRSLLWSLIGFKGMLVIEFGVTREHCISAYKLAHKFKMANRGKNDWNRYGLSSPGPCLWVVGPEDSIHIPNFSMDRVEVSVSDIAAGDVEAVVDQRNIYASILKAIRRTYSLAR